MYVEKLCDVVITGIRVLLPEGGPNSSGLLLDECTFVCDGLGGVSGVVGEGDDKRRPCMLVCP